MHFITSRKLLSIICSKFFFLSLLLFSWSFIMHILFLHFLMASYKLLRFCSFSLLSFLFYSLHSIFSVVLPSSLSIIFSTNSNLLLNSFSEYFILIILSAPEYIVVVLKPLINRPRYWTVCVFILFFGTNHTLLFLCMTCDF